MLLRVPEKKRFSFFWVKCSGRFCFILKIFLHCNEIFSRLHLLYYCYQNNNLLSFSVKKDCLRVLQSSGVQDPDFGVQSGRIFGFFWIWIGYRFPFNRIRIIQMK